MITFTKTNISDLYILEPQVFGDDRGFFMETYSQKDFLNAGLDYHRVQDNHSKSAKGVLRGMHIQNTNTQSKLIRVVAGSIYDVVVDARKDSDTYGQYFAILLSAENKKQLLIPKGFLHGFLSLEDDTEIVYKCDDIYNPSAEVAVQRDDPDLTIDRGSYISQYNISNISLSKKDQIAISRSEYNTYIS